MQRHAEQVRRRASELSTKAYWNQFKQSPEFVVMFLPGEAFLYGAVENDPGLLEDFMQSRVIVATPTTLIALLKAIEFGWRQESIAENAEEIRKHGKDLYDRIVILASHFAKLGAGLDASVRCYNEALGSLEARVLVTARKIAELGAKTEKDLPELEPIDRQARELSSSLFGETE
jgi:DNA recombination protein RmuC